jgi:Holliday junction resolvase
MNPRYNRQKGKAGEREVADILTKLSGVKYRRVPSSGAMHGFLNFDLMKEDPRAESIFDGIGNEVKNTKTLKIPEWIEQIKTACDDANMRFNPRWFIAFRLKGEWFFVLNEAYFSELNKALLELSTDGPLTSQELL